MLSGPELAWVLPFGVPYIACSIRLDPLALFFLLTLSILGASVAVYSIGYLRHGPSGKNPALSCALLNLLLASLTLVFTASEVVFFLIAWELVVAVAYFLVVTNHESVEVRQGGFVYILMSRGGTGMLFIGLLLLASAAGTTDFRAMHGIGDKLPAAVGGLAFVCLFLGFGVKAGIVPLHIWLPAAHPVAPSNVSALMSGVLIKTGIYGMTRVFFDFYGALPAWAGMLVLAGSARFPPCWVFFYALMEHDLKRLLAYHSIENIGIILMGLRCGAAVPAYGHPVLAALALIAGLYHTINHGVFKACCSSARARAARHAHPEHGGDGRADPADAVDGAVLPDRRHRHLRPAAAERVRQRVAHLPGAAGGLRRNHGV